MAGSKKTKVEKSRGCIKKRLARGGVVLSKQVDGKETLE